MIYKSKFPELADQVVSACPAVTRTDTCSQIAMNITTGRMRLTGVLLLGIGSTKSVIAAEMPGMLPRPRTPQLRQKDAAPRIGTVSINSLRARSRHH